MSCRVERGWNWSSGKIGKGLKFNRDFTFLQGQCPSLLCRLSSSMGWEPGWRVLPLFNFCCFHHPEECVLSLVSALSIPGKDADWHRCPLVDQLRPGRQHPRKNRGVETPGNNPPNVLCSGALTRWLGCHTLSLRLYRAPYIIAPLAWGES